MRMMIGPDSYDCREEKMGMHINLFFNLKKSDKMLVAKTTLPWAQAFPNLFIHHIHSPQCSCAKP